MVRSFTAIPWLALSLGALVACSSDKKESAESYFQIPATPQSTPGDPVQGKFELLNGSFMSCGIPWKMWSDPTLGPVVQQSFGSGAVDTLPDRNADNAAMPYSMNVFTATDGAKVVNSNCLTCHGGKFDGDLVIGLGNPAVDWTNQVGGGVGSGSLDTLATAAGLDAPETDNLAKMLRMGDVVAPAMVMRTVGQNPAEQLTGVLISHHDKDTLAWSDTPLLDIPHPVLDEQGNVIPDARLTSDPPPWWRAHKKHALFYNAMARGEHRGTMALATAICVDNLTEAQRVDDIFVDIQAFIGTVRPPAYKRPIDQALAADGKDVFAVTCSRCHGTYADDPADDAHDTYPNLLIPLDVIGTDTAVADAPLLNPEGVVWYNESFYGQITKAVPDDPYAGYVPPPLDGIWATAPYLHNGSVPSVALLLNSKARPKYWKRVDFDTTNFDEENLGWPYVEVAYSQADAPADEKKFIYDTTYWSQTNGGHTFGDDLTDAERRAVIEYLKTL